MLTEGSEELTVAQIRATPIIRLKKRISEPDFRPQEPLDPLLQAAEMLEVNGEIQTGAQEPTAPSLVKKKKKMRSFSPSAGSTDGTSSQTQASLRHKTKYIN